MKFEIEMYELTFRENKSESKRILRTIHLDDLKHFIAGLKHILSIEIDEEYHSEISLRIKKFKNGKHKIFYDFINSKELRKGVKMIIESSYPIIC